MIEKLVPIGLALIIVGGVGCAIEYVLFGTGNFILVGYFGLIISLIPFVIAVRHMEGGS